jgi:hypothetical protein
MPFGQGGWLLLEPWITPTIFEEVNVDGNRGKIVDEWTYIDRVNDVFAKERLNRYTMGRCRECFIICPFVLN